VEVWWLYFHDQYGGTWKYGSFGQISAVWAIEGSEIDKPEITKPDIAGLFLDCNYNLSCVEKLIISGFHGSVVIRR